MTCLCEQCAGLCCRYFALPIDNPTCAHDYDNIRWYLLHENVTVFVEAKQWYIGIANRCKALQADNRCGVYETRPKVCRGYSMDNCDYHGGEYEFEILFTSAEQLEIYAAKKLLGGKRKKSGRGSVTRKPKRDLKKLSEKLTEKLMGSGGPLGVPVASGNGKGVSLPLLRS